MVFGILRLCLHHSAFRKTSRDLWFMPPRFHQPLTAIDDIHFRVLTLRRVRWVNPVESLGTLWSHSSTAATKWQRNVGPPPPPPEGTGSRGKEPTGNCRLKGEYWIIAWLWKQQLQALDRTYVCRLWSSGNSLWIYIYLYICMYIGMLWYKCFGGWRSPPINRVSPQVHIDLYIYIYVCSYLPIYIYTYIYILYPFTLCLQNCFGWWVPRAYLDWVRWVTCIDYSPRFRWWLFHLLGFDEWHIQVVYFKKCCSPPEADVVPLKIYIWLKMLVYSLVSSE